MKLKFSFIILLLALFVPFEVVILKYLPVSDTIYSYLRFAVEIVVYLLAGIVLVRYISVKKLPKGTSIDKPLLIFIGYALVITVINHAPILQSLIGIRALLRYVPLFYVMAFINFEEGFTRKLLRGVLFITGIQCMVAFYQHYFGIADFWYPRASDLEIAGKQVNFRLLASGFGSGREMGAGIGTFGDSVYLALFLVISFAIAVATQQKNIGLPKYYKLVFLIILLMNAVALFFTYSRGSVLVAIAAIPIIIYLAGGRKKIFVYSMAAIVLITPIVIFSVFQQTPSSTYVNPKTKYTDPFSNMTAVFNSSYVDNTMQFSRGAVLTEIGGNLISSFKLLGYSPAQDFALDKASTNLFGSNMPINNLPIINDVYWVAFVIYYGLIGLAIYFFILFKIFKASVFVFKNTDDPYFKIFALAMAAIIIICIPYSLILRTFVFRSFSFYFWLLAGLIFNEWRRLMNIDYQHITNMK